MKRLAYPLGVVAVFSLLFWCLPAYLAASEALQNANLKTRDTFFKIRHFSTTPPKISEDVVIIAIDEESCEKLQARWPWSRVMLSDMVHELRAAEAKVIGMNLSFVGLEDGNDFSSRELANRMREHGNVVIGSTFDRAGQFMRPNELLAAAARHYGYLEKILDPDFVIRRSYLLRLYREKNMPLGAEEVAPDRNFESSFPLQLLAAYYAPAPAPRFSRDLGLLTLGRPTLGAALNRDGSYTINYLLSDRDLRQISAWKIVQGKILPDALRGKVALVGLTSPLFSDVHSTPMGMVPGIFIHANEFISIASGRALRFVPDHVTFFLSWLVALCVLALFLFRRFWLGTFGFLTAFAGLFMGIQFALARDLVIEPFILLIGPVSALVAGVFSHSLKLLLDNKGLETKVIHDKLTGLYKYEYLRECLEEEWKRCQRGNLPVSIVMTDLDRFKGINDTLGHETGNEMIVRAGEVIRESARRYDIVSRYGGDEFVILLWHTNRAEAEAYRTRLRDLYHTMAKKLNEPLLKESSISIGVASFEPAVNPQYPPDPQRLIEDADKDLFTDKEARRRPGEVQR